MNRGMSSTLSSNGLKRINIESYYLRNVVATVKGVNQRLLLDLRITPNPK
jgi:hypothetical protein